MSSLSEVLHVAATLGAGLVAGLCMTFDAFVMRALDRLGAPVAIRAMQAINAVILRSGAMVVWFATVPVGVAASLAADEPARAWAATGLYAVGAILITGRGNVPLNEALDRVSVAEPVVDGAADTVALDVWQRYRTQWGRWNRLRMVVIAGRRCSMPYGDAQRLPNACRTRGGDGRNA